MPGLQAGRLRERITIRRLSDTATGKGGFTRGWSTLWTDVPAEVVGTSGQERVFANTLQGVASFRITIQFLDDIRTNDQVLWNGIELNVTAPPNDVSGRRQWLQIFADTSAPQGA